MTKRLLLSTGLAGFALLPASALAADPNAEASAPVAAVASSATAAAASSVHQPEADTIVVTASPLERPADALLTPASVLDGQELQRQLRGTLGETLRREPGLSSTGFGAGASRPIIRGLGGDRIRTLVNGVGSIDAAAASPDHAVPIEPALAQRIEVVRGPSLLRYGSSAAGGVVNVLDGRIPSEAPEDGLDGKVRLGAATVDESVEAVAGASALLGEGNGFSVVATGALSVRDAQDYEIPGYAESSILRALEEAEHEEEHEGEEHGEDEHDEEKGLLKNSFNEFESASGGLSFIGDRGFLGFSVQSLSNSYGIPGGGHGHGGHDEEEHEEHDEEEHEGEEHEEGHGHGHEGVFIELEQNRFDVNGSLELGGAFERLDIFGGYADYEHTEFEGPGEIGTVFGNEGYEIRAEAIQTPRGNWRGANGVQYRSREFSAIGEEAFVPPTETRQIGIFTVQEWSFGGTIFEAAARYENTEQEDALGGDSQDFDALSASVGVHSDIGGNNHVSASILRTERAPGSEELYSNGPHLATSSFDIGDPTLGTETALGAELGYRFEGDRLRFALTGFYTDYEDFIYQAFTGQTGEDILLAAGEDDEEELEEFGGLDVLRYTAADAVFYGLEFEGSADLGTVGGAAFSADVVADWVDATLDEVDLSGSDQLPRIPPLGIIAGVNAEVGQLDLRFEAEHAAEADETAAFELPTDSFTLLNFYADYDFNETVGVSFSVLNASDEDARLHTSFLKDTVPLPGRNFRFSLNWRF